MPIKDNYQMVIYGDSITKGVVLDEERSRYVLLKDSFSEIIKREFKGVIHAVGKFGNTIIGAAERLQRLVLKKNPDIVLLEFGGNDCDFDWAEVARHPYQDHTPNTSVDEFREKLGVMVETLRQNSIVPVFMSLPPLDAERYFKWISKNDPDYGKNILIWLEAISKIYWWHERYNAAILSVAEETNTKLIDVRGAFLKEHDFRSYICNDGIHPNEQGHRVIAEQILKFAQENYSFLMKERGSISQI